MKTSDLSSIMRRAWELFRATGRTFAECLSRSWAIYRLIRRMRAGVVRFAYEKADGTIRAAKGTLQDVFPLVKGTGTASPKTVRYYDIEAAGWRSFRVENLIAVY